MKIQLLAIFIATLFSTETFSQIAPGDSNDGITGTTQPCGTFFKRNNGDGTCGGDAEIRLSFSQQPDYAPTLVAIWYDGQQANDVILPVEGDMSSLDKGYISYCLQGSNIPAAKKLTLQFHYESGQDDCVLSE